jgi:outer membrane protein, heavy metal efflux system
MRHSVAVMLLLVTAVSSLGAAEPVTDANVPATLQDYLRFAARNNAGLEAAFEEWKAAVEQVPQAKALPDPRFTYGYFIDEVETRVGPQEHRLSLMQVFPWFGTIAARTDAASANAQAAYQRYQAKKLDVFYDVKDAFYEYVYLRRAIAIAEDNVDLLRHFEEVARTKYTTATAGHPDIIRAQVELATLQDKLVALEEMRAPIVARLNAALNRPTTESLPWPEYERHEPVEVDASEVLAVLQRQNPQLQALDFEIEAARSRIELAKKEFYPEIGVGVDWIMTGDAISPGVRDSGKDPVILMFNLNVPIWRKSYSAAELQARAQSRRALRQRQDMENNLLARAQRALYDFEDSGRKLVLYDEILVPKAEELVGASETAYTAGTIDFLSLIDAERMLLRFSLERERARTDQRQRLAQLEMLAGTELAGFGGD